jgi:HSP20 family protein
MAQAMTRSDRGVAPRQDGGEPTRTRAVFRPVTDIYETDEGVVLLMEMPGVAPEGVDLTLERRVLTVRGRGPDQRHEGYRRIHAEYEVGDYERVFTLSEDIDQQGIQATQKDGVLMLALPKAGPAKARKIEVKAA